MTKRPWADTPFPLIPTPSGPSIQNISPGTLKVATEMCLAHNLILRNLNAIYLQAPNISKDSPTDIRDFILFCQVFHESVSHHHDYEESTFFPSIEEYTKEKGIMETSMRQHEAFHAGLEEFGEYVYGVGVEEWDAKRLLGIVDGFGEALQLHLRDEIETLLGLEKYGGDKLQKAWDELEAKIQREMTDKLKVIPAGLGAIDRTFEGGRHKHWPPFPWFVPYLVKYFFMWKYRGVWRFSPCTVFGEPKELPFVKVEQ
ncbi:uncharacterized protein PAC_11986 [Phialocephala subalpina]|uniref:Hemerythrin-like domain-containing protein n=1 Tax=Phialocephala subalpina TaxID=576137 RepID=A0A1L7XAP0_9HELO|nr:uncharacterized protein PAC_11986 [Phialocephala subalpina]